MPNSTDRTLQGANYGAITGAFTFLILLLCISITKDIVNGIATHGIKHTLNKEGFSAKIALLTVGLYLITGITIGAILGSIAGTMYGSGESIGESLRFFKNVRDETFASASPNASAICGPSP